MAADRREERGAALLTVLLIVAVISVLAATALERLRLATRLAGNVVAVDQARGYAMAAETLMQLRVNRLLASNPTRITLDGGWAGRPFQLAVPGGLITATVTDGGNCFNLNGLVKAQGDDQLIAQPPAIEQFVRLMRLLGIVDQVARPIAAATADWIDTDNDPQPQGAEDTRYQGGDAGYRTAGTLMADPSELRAVTGVTPEIYTKLRPWLCTLPIAKPARINVNTLLPEQAPLFAMLLPGTLDVERAHAILLERPAQGFSSTFEFWRLPARNGITADPLATAQTAVTTQWFNLAIQVRMGDAELNETALIDASGQNAQIAARSWGDPA